MKKKRKSERKLKKEIVTLVLAQLFISYLGRAMNTKREFSSIQFGENRANFADILLGRIRNALGWKTGEGPEN